MKFEIDLNEILQDDDGNVIEDLQQSVKRQIIEKLTTEVSKGIKAQINAEVAAVISEQLKLYASEQMPKLIDQMMDAEYHQVNRWGEQERECTTFRKELVKSIQDQMVYKKTSFESEKNAFTKGVDQCVADNIAKMKVDFDKNIREMFQKEAWDYAIKQMSAKLGVKV